MRTARALTALAIVVAACAQPIAPGTVPFGFTRSSGPLQLQVEDRLRSAVNRIRIRDVHRELTRLPHPAGSHRDRELADWTARQFTDSGLQDVSVTTHEVMLPRPLSVSVEMTRPRPWRATLVEEPVNDRDTHIDPAAIGPPHHAFSASGEITAPVVYAGFGMPRDYDWLDTRGIAVRGKIVLVRLSRPYSYRGYKAFVAEQRGVAGVVMFADPADDGAVKGNAYPDGPWAPDSRTERGSIAYDFLVPGDPLTPGWPSVPGARRLPRSEAVSLPKIISVPLSARDARPILDAMDGIPAPDDWRGGLPIQYRVGGGRAHVRLAVRMDDSVRPVWTVTGMIPGDQRPDEVVIVGNHRDAWIYGGIDPSSGSAALIELARVLGGLTRAGWRPTRSILFASWDAEEYALTSSTEWGEQHAAWLDERAVAYLNVDSAASGSKFVAGSVPSLSGLIGDVAQAVDDPVRRVPLPVAARDRARAEGATGGEGGMSIVDDRLGGGSDYAVFLNFLGIPVADLAFDGPHGVYHSLYDTHEFVARIGDPEFRYHAALVQVWGLAALRLAEADALPFDPEASAMRVLDYVRQANDRLTWLKSGGSLGEAEAAASSLRDASSAFNNARRSALDRQDVGALATMNASVLRFERAFIDREGLRGRRWYRHAIYAPRFTYEPQPLPGLHDAIDSGDAQRVADQAARLAAVLQRAANHLRVTESQ